MKKGYTLHIGILVLYYIIYIIALIQNSTLWGDILSPIGNLLTLACILAAIIRYHKINLASWVYISLGLASLTWLISDMIWILYELVFHTDPNEENLFMVLYLLPNLFFAISAGVAVTIHRNKAGTAQLILDILAMVSMEAILLWLLFFRNHITVTHHPDLAKLMILFYAVCDLFAISSIIIWLASLRWMSIGRIRILISAGILVYSLIDVVYAYLYLNGQYIPNTIVDGIYIGAFLLLAAGCISNNFHLPDLAGPIDNNTDVLNSNAKNIKTGFLLTVPVILLVLDRNIAVSEVLLILLIAITYHVISSFLESSAKSKLLLSSERLTNATLEKCVAQRTQQLTAANCELDLLSKQDFITPLYNRRFFLTELGRLIENSKNGQTIALFYIDLDHFKAINDTYGHDTGDAVLIEIARRLSSVATEGTLLARLGGDEFVFAFPGCSNVGQAEKIVKQIYQCCEAQIKLDPYDFNITLSIGITFYPADAQDRGILMKNADIAMYYAKEQGINQHAYFSSLLHERVIRRNNLELGLKKSNFDKEFELVYQPQVTIPDRKVTGAEALLRWHHPELGLITPDEFIPIAEETGLIVPLGDWIIHSALRQASKWNRLNDQPIKIGVNISSLQLANVSFAARLLNAMSEYEVQAEWVDIEITENAAMKEADKANEVFRAITEMGITISIDDFGTGYSSLSYLKKFAIDRIKIAKPLVDNLANDYRDANIVKAIISMAKALGIRVIAEGVEFEDQFKTLAEYSCDEVQGYLTGKPMSAAVFEKLFLQKFNPNPSNISKRPSDCISDIRAHASLMAVQSPDENSLCT